MIIVDQTRNIETHAVNVWFSIPDASPRLRYGNGKQTWRPRKGVVTWTRDRVNGGEWSPWRATDMQWAGPRLRADGSDSAAEPIREVITDRYSKAAGEIAEATRPADAEHLPPAVSDA